MKEKIEEVLDKYVRPGLAMDGGGVDLVDVNEETGEVKVRLTGGCVGCPMSQLTLQMGVEKTLKEHIPEVTKVIAA